MMLKKLWAEFRKPSKRNPEPHHRGAAGVWHSALGAVPGLILADYGGLPALVAIPTIVLVYFWKEFGDLKRNGSIADSIEDAAFVAAGALSAYHEALFGLIAINAGALAVMALQIKDDEDGR